MPSRGLDSMSMTNPTHAVVLFAAFLFLAGLLAAGPTIVALASALAPLLLAVGLVVAVLRLVWHYTNRDQ